MLAAWRPDLTAYREVEEAYRISLKSLARRYLELHDEIADLDDMIEAIVKDLAPDGTKWIACRKTFFLSVRVLSRLYRRLILEGLAKLHKAGELRFFGDHAELADPAAFDAFLQPLRQTDWIVYAKEPFAGPKAVLAYPPLSDASITCRARVALHAPHRDLQQPPDPVR